MDWRVHLKSIKVAYDAWCETHPNEPCGIEDCDELMKKYYPGRYRVVERLDSEQGWILDLEFDDEQEKTLWLLSQKS